MTHPASSSAPPSEVASMLDILQMQQYLKVFHELGLHTIDSLLPALDDDAAGGGGKESAWVKRITKTQDRNIILGYLSIRRKKDKREAAKSEQRMHTFRLIKDSLAELQSLQLKKAELERGSTVLNRKESIRQEIENILDKIDETKAKLEAAQKEISKSGETGGRPSALAEVASRRPHSAYSDKLRHATKHAKSSAAPTSPRLANEGADEPHPPTEASGVTSSWAQHKEQPWVAPSPQRKPMSARRSSGADSTTNAADGVKGNPFGGTCFDRVQFNSTTSRPPSAGSTHSARRAFETVDTHNARDVGPGWNKNPIVPRMRHVALRCTSASSARGGRSASELPGIEGLSVTGQRATPVALGIHLETDHYAQMCCGAVGRHL